MVLLLKNSLVYSNLLTSKNITLTDFYIKNNAHHLILPLISLNNKLFGTLMENIIIEHINAEKSKLSSYDYLYNKSNKAIKIEQKSSRYWRSINDFKWQHVMLKHDYDMLLLIGIDFDDIKIYAISKKNIINLFNQKKIKIQGKSTDGQGLWFSRNSIKTHLTQIKSIKELDTFISNNNFN
jgi:hypothetical protein